MKKLIMTIGLPGSGKTTWAREYAEQMREVGERVDIVCKDDIRKAMSATGWVWSKSGEVEVLKMRDSLIKSAFSHGVSVVISTDTNFGRHKNRLAELARQHKADFEVKDFTHVPVDVCIERDGKRKESVGPEVIKNMFNKYLAVPEARRYTPDQNKPLAIICDLDGTVALHEGRRSPYDYARVGEDALNVPVAELVKRYAKDHIILYVSGREQFCRPQTEDWLQRYGLPASEPNKLMMRPTGDHRKDFVVKQEIFDTYIRENYNVQFVLDDRNQVVSMWRRLGLACFQVNEGDF
jgi:predicted kinase